jgi:hypothetical protein
MTRNENQKLSYKQTKTKRQASDEANGSRQGS